MVVVQRRAGADAAELRERFDRRALEDVAATLPEELRDLALHVLSVARLPPEHENRGGARVLVARLVQREAPDDLERLGALDPRQGALHLRRELVEGRSDREPLLQPRQGL